MGWDKTGWPGFELFWICVVVLWAALLLNIFRKRQIPWDETGVAVFLTYVSTRHNFGVPFLVLFAVPLAARLLHEHLAKRTWPAPLKEVHAPLLSLGVVVFLVLCSRVSVTGGFDKTSTPVSACDFIESQKIGGRFYNDYFFGGYWMWRFAGSPPVFIDGRYPAVEGYQPLLQDIYQSKFNKPEVWAEFLRRHSIQGALVKYLRDSPYPSLYEVHFPKKDWALVHWNDAGLLFLRRDVREYARVIQEWEFKEVLPDAAPAYVQQRYREASPHARIRMREELQRNAALHPDSRRTRQLWDLIAQSAAIEGQTQRE
jgi:hypothetical protein